MWAPGRNKPAQPSQIPSLFLLVLRPDGTVALIARIKREKAERP